MIDRRQFIKNAGALSLCSAAGTASMLATFDAFAAGAPGYKALVCVFLYGGMDNNDTILPYDQLSYDRYAEIRQPLVTAYRGSRSLENLLRLDARNPAQFGSRQFAMPAELAPLHDLFAAGSAAIVGNVGPLVEPITRTAYTTGARGVPARLFSHNDQRSMWMSLHPEGAMSGWGGRFADAHIRSEANIRDAFSAISTFEKPEFLSGGLVRAYSIASEGVPSIQVLTLPHLDFRGHLSDAGYTMLREHFSSAEFDGANALERELAAEHKRSFENNELFRSSFASAPESTVAFPSSELGLQLSAVAKTIAMQNQLGASRQVFFVGRRGFDTHSAQASALPALQVELGQAIAAFYEAMQDLGTALDVTLFTASEFGRSLTVNGDGTDHGWGGHHFVVGDSVLGGRIYGDIPPYDFEHDHDAGHGRLIPAVSIHQYAATLGRWFGLSYNELVAALPGLENFPQADLGFMV